MTPYVDADELRAEIAELETYRHRLELKALAIEAEDPARADLCDMMADSAGDEIGKLRMQLGELEEEIADKEAASDRAWGRWATGPGSAR